MYSVSARCNKMKIDRDLIERYHRGACSRSERDAVEEWLFSAESEELPDLREGESKELLKEQMWEDIATVLPDEEPYLPLKQMAGADRFWLGAVAASLLAGLLCIATYFMIEGSGKAVQPLVSVYNESATQIRRMEYSGYNLSVGRNTRATIDNLTGDANLSGSLLISPKRDMELRFKGSSEPVTFSSGKTYVILKNGSDQGRVLIVTENNMMDLPPVLQKQIINEFDI